MSETVEPLLRDLLAWLLREERSYDDVMEAWRTSCPRLPVWEEANARGFVERRWTEGRAIVSATQAGCAFLSAQ